MNVKMIYVEITNQCNLNCRTCYNRSGLNYEVKEISKAQLEAVIQEFLPFGLNRFIFSGGEPTLHSEFSEILDLVDRYPQISFGIVTNGTNPDQKLIEMLNTRTNFSLQISLDGSSEEQNRKTRGSGNFEKAVAFAKQIHPLESKPLLKMVLSQQNIGDVESFYRLACSLRFTPEFAFIFKSGNGSEHWEAKALTAQQKFKVLQLIKHLNQSSQVEAFLPVCSMKCPYTDPSEPLSLCIKTDGSIQPCQPLYDSGYTLGNVFELNWDSLSSKVNEITMLALQRLQTDYDCGKCLLQAGCQKGCMAAAFNLHGAPLQEDGECDYRKMIFLDRTLSTIKKERTNYE